MKQRIEDIPIFVVHVGAHTQRAEHIEAMMARMGLRFEYMLKGDIADLGDELPSKCFHGEVRDSKPAASCLYKHLLIYKEMIARNLPGAIVLEDDIFLKKNFIPVMEAAIAESAQLPADEQFIMSPDESALKLVPRSQRQKGKYLYVGKKNRFTGCYYLPLRTAKLIIDDIEQNGTTRPADWVHEELLRAGKLKYYWIYPEVAIQGSFTSAFNTTVAKDKRKQNVQKLHWLFKLWYKRLLYFLR